MNIVQKLYREALFFFPNILKCLLGIKQFYNMYNIRVIILDMLMDELPMYSDTPNPDSPNDTIREWYKFLINKNV